MSKNLLSIILLGIFLGCATTGHKFDAAAIDRIEVAKTTQSDVISMLGEPESITKCNNGINIWYYSFYLSQRAFETAEIWFFNGYVIRKFKRVGGNMNRLTLG